MTKLSDLPEFIGSWRTMPGKWTDCFHICPDCGQAVEVRDLRQIYWHSRLGHKRLELDS